jgi:hypothetical protein
MHCLFGKRARAVDGCNSSRPPLVRDIHDPSSDFWAKCPEVAPKMSDELHRRIEGLRAATDWKSSSRSSATWRHGPWAWGAASIRRQRLCPPPRGVFPGREPSPTNEHERAGQEQTAEPNQSGSARRPQRRIRRPRSALWTNVPDGAPDAGHHHAHGRVERYQPRGAREQRDVDAVVPAVRHGDTGDVENLGAVHAGARFDLRGAAFFFAPTQSLQAAKTEPERYVPE